MTRHKHTHTGLVTPQLPQLWLTAVLRLLAMLVSNVASTLQMIRRREAVNATRATPASLPGEKIDTHQEPNAAQHRSPIALMLRSAAKLRVSKHEGVLTAVSSSPSPSVSHATRAIHLPCYAGGGQGGERPPPPQAGEVDRRVFAARRRGRPSANPRPDSAPN